MSSWCVDIEISYVSDHIHCTDVVDSVVVDQIHDVLHVLPSFALWGRYWWRIQCHTAVLLLLEVTFPMCADFINCWWYRVTRTHSCLSLNEWLREMIKETIYDFLWARSGWMFSWARTQKLQVDVFEWITSCVPVWLPLSPTLYCNKNDSCEMSDELLKEYSVLAWNSLPPHTPS